MRGLLKSTLPLLILALCLLTSCANKTVAPSASWQFFVGRDDGESLERPLLYRAWVPSQWLRQDPPATESITDSTKANCEFYIQDNHQSIRLTLHTFPILQDNRRIPPEAQITRWKGQFEELDPIKTHTLPNSHGGFSGLFFEGQGILQGNTTKVMGWSMQLASLYGRLLNQGKKPLDLIKRADYTIKASGPPDLMDKYRIEILAFAQSFELIDELPTPP